MNQKLNIIIDKIVDVNKIGLLYLTKKPNNITNRDIDIDKKLKKLNNKTDRI